MDILLVSGRSRGAEPHPSRELAAELARDLAHLDHRVRWLCPVLRGGGPAVQLPPGASFRPVVSRPAPFRAVQKSTSDVPLDCALTEEIRRELPDVVHVLAFGGSISAGLPWIAERLGVPVVVSADARELLCHRGTLINERGEDCTAWNEPERCVTCCMTAFAGGLTPREARRGHRLRFLGPWSPYPQAFAFASRLDVLVGALIPATRVLVADEEQRQHLASVGVPARALRVLASSEVSAESLVALYREASHAWT